MNMWKRGGIIFGSGIIASILVMGLLWLVFPHRYTSSTTVLVTQKFTLTDSYTASKSAEKISRGLSEVIYTTSFIDRVAETNIVNIDDLLAMSEREKRDEWKGMVAARAISGTSFLEVFAFDEDPARSAKLAEALATVLVYNGDQYHGAGDTVDMQIVNDVLTSSYPTKPNLVLYGPAAFVLGAVLAAVLLFFYSSTNFAGLRGGGGAGPVVHQPEPELSPGIQAPPVHHVAPAMPAQHEQHRVEQPTQLPPQNHHGGGVFPQ